MENRTAVIPLEEYEEYKKLLEQIKDGKYIQIHSAWSNYGETFYVRGFTESEVIRHIENSNKSLIEENKRLSDLIDESLNYSQEPKEKKTWWKIK